MHVIGGPDIQEFMTGNWAKKCHNNITYSLEQREDRKLVN